MEKKPRVSVVLPCLDEEESIGTCLDQIENVLRENGLDAEILIVDNGSQDRSIEIAKMKRLKNLRIVEEKRKGYGSAYLKGIREARGDYIFMSDSDGTYDFRNLPRFIKRLDRGCDFVIGNRFTDKMDKKSMPFMNRRLGNPLLSGILRLFFGASVSDAHCGMRAIKKEAIEKLNLRTTGMEFASEMIIKALRKNLKICEIPIGYHPRKGETKLKKFRDGWRHLRFMLLYSPLFLFLIPGLVLFSLGILSMVWIYFGLAQLGNIEIHFHPMFLSSLLIILGYQLVLFGFFAKNYSIVHLDERDERIERLFKKITIEKVSLFGIGFVLLGLIIYISIFNDWIINDFGSLNAIKESIIALTGIVLGIQSIFSAFMLSIIGIKEK